MNFDMLKNAAKLANQIGNREIYTALIEAQLQGLELLEENRQLKEDLNALEELEHTRENLELHGNFYYLKGTEGPPYCTRCWDADRKLITCHLTTNVNKSRRGKCPNCNIERYCKPLAQ